MIMYGSIKSLLGSFGPRLIFDRMMNIYPQ